MGTEKTRKKKKSGSRRPSPSPKNNSNNPLKKILREVIILIIGKQAEEIVDLLDAKKHVNEFVIAKKLDLTINQTRNILYKISDYGLVSYIRKKDKKKGWYTYFWKIEILKSLEFMKNNLLKKIDQLEHKIKSRETKRFYVCERCNIELTEENALICNFTCNECGDILVLKDNVKLIKEMKKNLEKLKRDLASLMEEMEKETEKVEKIKVREIKKREKIKTLKRLKRRKAAKKKKIVKKTKKKSIKKTRKRPIKKPAKKVKPKAKVGKKPVKKLKAKRKKSRK